MDIRIVTIWALLSLLAACQGTPSPSQTANQDQLFILTEDQLNLHYRKAGTGTQTLVFVHGWGIDGSYFQHQLEAFQEKYQVISVDLPGHGLSDDTRTQWRMRQFGRDIQKLVLDLKLEDVILIGHSMSEVVVAEAAALLGDKVQAIIGIDTYINPVEQVSPTDSANIIGAMSQDFGGTIHAWMGSYFPENADTSITHFILKDMAACPAEICIEIMKDLIVYQNSGRFPELLANLAIPIRTINVIEPEAAAWAEIDADFDYVLLKNSGHYPMLEIVAPFNQALSQSLNNIVQP